MRECSPCNGGSTLLAGAPKAHAYANGQHMRRWGRAAEPALQGCSAPVQHSSAAQCKGLALSLACRMTSSSRRTRLLQRSPPGQVQELPPRYAKFVCLSLRKAVTPQRMGWCWLLSLSCNRLPRALPLLHVCTGGPQGHWWCPQGHWWCAQGHWWCAQVQRCCQEAGVCSSRHAALLMGGWAAPTMHHRHGERPSTHMPPVHPCRR